tara:strand:+ start:225 stop:1715 length:1491 start_codon:yes stop_codon:yes gene_type:complete
MSKVLTAKDYAEKEKKLLEKVISTKQYKDLQSDEKQKLIDIVEKFLKEKRLVCYGGTAINNLLPVSKQFYKKTEFPDYDFFSPNALEDAKRLTDIYYKAGFADTYTKSGVHHGTYKVYAGEESVADITQIDKKLFKNVQENSEKRDGILYCPVDFLRMNMYLELSRPAGDISRWTKVHDRLMLFDETYPFDNSSCTTKWYEKANDELIDDLQDRTDGNHTDVESMYSKAVSYCVEIGAVFIGSLAMEEYSKYLLEKSHRMETFQTFMVFVENLERRSRALSNVLRSMNEVKRVDVVESKGIADLIPPHNIIYVTDSKNIKEPLTIMFQTEACYSYNELPSKDGGQIRIASIETLMNMYLAFQYDEDKVDEKLINKGRLMCAATELYKIQKENRLAQRGVLKRFSLNCYGHQPSKAEMLKKKRDKIKELSKDKDSKEYESWALNYQPSEIETKKKAEKVSNKKKTVKKTASAGKKSKGSTKETKKSSKKTAKKKSKK